MKTRALGTSGLDLSVIGYGAWEASEHWGPVDEDGIVGAIVAAFDAGINWLDTAEVYGPHTSEELAGRALAERPAMMVATKVAPTPGGSGFATDQVRRACEDSLKRLGRETIDLYQLHWPDKNVPVEETWHAMADLASEGLVRAIGVSNFPVPLIEACEQIRHVDSLQPHVSLLHRSNLDLVRWCGERQIGTVAYSPLACGLLSGTITSESTFDRNDWRSGERGFQLYEPLFGPANVKGNLATVERLRPVAERLGVTLAQLAIAWVLHQEGITAAIVGSRSAKHVESNVAAATLALDEAALAGIAAALEG
ncbi:MAG TPA: aldo/keto reductase [Actinomycetota bacterium]